MTGEIIKLDSANINSYINSLEQLEKQCFGSLAWSKKQLLDELNNTFSVMCAYIIGTEAVGYINARVMPDELQIGNVAVFEQYRSKGFATALIQYLINIAQQSSCLTVQLEVATDNVPAINLYEKLNFVKAGLRRNFYSGCSHGSRDAFTMVLTL